MKQSKTVDFTYNNYLHSIRYDGQEIDRVHVKELLQYYKNRLNLFRESTPLFFVIDYTRMSYLFFSESCKQVTGYDAMHFLNGGLDLSIELMHKDYWKVYNQKVFPAIAKTLTAYPMHEHRNINFTFNAQLKCANRSWVNLLQSSRYITSDTTGMPLFCLGMIIDITEFKNDSLMNYKAELTNLQTGRVKLVDHKHYFVNEEDKLLTKKEKQILSYLAEGKSTRAISEKLKTSEYTIDNHRKNMLTKTETNNVAHLIWFCTKHRII